MVFASFSFVKCICSVTVYYICYNKRFTEWSKRQRITALNSHIIAYEHNSHNPAREKRDHCSDASPHCKKNEYIDKLIAFLCSNCSAYMRDRHMAANSAQWTMRFMVWINWRVLSLRNCTTATISILFNWILWVYAVYVMLLLRWHTVVALCTACVN